jgi:hypothetical protein
MVNFLLLWYWIWVCFSFMSRMGYYALNILVSSVCFQFAWLVICSLITWPCWQQTTARVYFKGDKSWQKYIKNTRKDLCDRNSHRGKSFETGIIPVARHSHPLSSVLFKNSTHWLSNPNIAFSYVNICIYIQWNLSKPIF